MFKLHYRFSKPVVRLSVFAAFLSVVLGFCCYMVQSDRDDEERDRFRVAWWSVNRGETAEVQAMLQHKKISKEDLSEMLLMVAGEEGMDVEPAVKTLSAMKVDTHIHDAEGRGVLQVARLHHHANMIVLLQKAGVTE